MSQIVEKIPSLCRSVEESLNKFLDPDPEADDCLDLTSPSLSTNTSLVKFPRRSESDHSFYPNLRYVRVQAIS